MSFRLKIVLWYSIAVLVTLVVVRLMTIEIVRHAAYDEVDNSLRAELAWVRHILADNRARGISDDETRRDIQLRSRLNSRKEFIAIHDAHDSVYLSSSNLEEETLPNSVTGWQPSTMEFRNQNMRLIGVKDGENSIAIGYMLTDVESAIEMISISINRILPIAVLFVVLGGLFLIGHLLAPINEVNRFLAAATTNPLSRDLPHLDLRRKDEIGELSRGVAEAVGKTRTTMRWILSYSSLVPHQLRTPITIMRNQLESVMQERATRPQLQQAVASTYDEILKLNNITENLLSLGKLQAGTLRLEMGKLHVKDFLKRFQEEACVLARSKNIQFVVEEGPDIEFMADEQWLQQAFFNLLDNAIRHTPQGGRITISYAAYGEVIELQFSDSGEGIPPVEIPGLFEPFFQGKYRDHSSSGAGLGLVLVKSIVSAHRGTIYATSPQGKGATFAITLPLEAAPTHRDVVVAHD